MPPDIYQKAFFINYAIGKFGSIIKNIGLYVCAELFRVSSGG